MSTLEHPPPVLPTPGTESHIMLLMRDHLAHVIQNKLVLGVVTLEGDHSTTNCLNAKKAMSMIYVE